MNDDSKHAKTNVHRSRCDDELPSREGYDVWNILATFHLPHLFDTTNDGADI
jgi:hypothetical protein